MRDPSYLRHLGELATLRNFLITTYYQTVWDDHDSDESIWAEYVHRAGRDTLPALVGQLQTLQERGPQELLGFFRAAGASPAGLHFEDAAEARAWTERFRAFLEGLFADR